MPAAQPALAPRPHDDRRLSSDHYLDQILPQTREWSSGADSAALYGEV